MARALIVGCGCRGRLLGEELLAQGWAVRGTSRREQGLEAIAAAGIEPALADLDRVGTVLEHVADVAVVYLLLGSAAGGPEAVAELHRHRLERLLEKLVDTPVRGVVYEAAGSVDPEVLAAGAELRSHRRADLADPGRDRQRGSGRSPFVGAGNGEVGSGAAFPSRRT